MRINWRFWEWRKPKYLPLKVGEVVPKELRRAGLERVRPEQFAGLYEDRCNDRSPIDGNGDWERCDLPVGHTNELEPNVHARVRFNVVRQIWNVEAW